MEITYKSPNGYSGKLYGKSSLIIFNPDGTESLHTGRRSINTYDELVELVEGHPAFLNSLANVFKEYKTKTNGDQIQEVFKPYKVAEHANRVSVYLTENDFMEGNRMFFDIEWWNKEYTKGINV